MRQLLSAFVYLCSVKEDLIDAASPDSIFNLPPDIQQEHVWCFWNRTEQRQIRMLSRSCRRLHDELLFYHYSRESSMYQLYLSIPHLQKLNDTLDVDDALAETFHPGILRINNVALPDRPHYIMMIEKIICQMMDTFGDWQIASNLSNHFICHLELSVLFYPRIKLMRSMITNLDLCGRIAQDSLSEIFRYGAAEMDKTGNKYNRYTRFGLIFLDIINDFQHHPKLNETQFQQRLRDIWNNIHRVEFIEDYLERKVMRTFPEYVYRATSLLVDSALGYNGLWDTNKLKWMVEFPRLFFDFDRIMINTALSARANEGNMMTLLRFLASNQLITWEEIHYHLRRLWMETQIDVFHFLYNWVTDQYHSLRMVST